MAPLDETTETARRGDLVTRRVLKILRHHSRTIQDEYMMVAIEDVAQHALARELEPPLTRDEIMMTATEHDQLLVVNRDGRTRIGIIPSGNNAQ